MTDISRRRALRALAIGAGMAGAASISPPAVLAAPTGETTAPLPSPPGDTTDSGTLTGRLVFPDDSDYDRARLGWNRAFNPLPLVIVFCQNERDVQNAITWSRQHHVPFRARGGRHALQGWSAVDEGVVIDVSDMRDIQVDLVDRTATVQTGATQDQIVNALGNRDVIIPTGGEIGVGLAGLTLGGGIGALNRTLGVTSDSLLSLDLVVPHGSHDTRLIRADETQHSDLLWASRGGGGGNFGIATSYTFRVYPLSTVTRYELTWDWRYLPVLFDAWQRITPHADDGLGSVFNAKSKINGMISCAGIYRGSSDALKSILQPLLDIGDPQVVIATEHYLDAWFALAGVADPPMSVRISSTWAHTRFPQPAIDTIGNYLAENPSVDAEIWCLNWGGEVGRIPSDATAFYHRDPKFYIEWNAAWENDTEKEYQIDWSERFGAALEPYTKGSYVNVPNDMLGDWPTAYYGDNYPRLRKVKSKYDPLEFFRYEQSITPLDTN